MPLIDFADEFHERVLEHRTHDGVEVLAVDGGNLGRDLDRHPHLERDTDGRVRTLLGRNAAEIVAHQRPSAADCRRMQK